MQLRNEKELSFHLCCRVSSVLPAAFRAGATSWYSRCWVLFLSNTRKISWGEIKQNILTAWKTAYTLAWCLSHRGVRFCSFTLVYLWYKKVDNFAKLKDRDKQFPVHLYTGRFSLAASTSNIMSSVICCWRYCCGVLMTLPSTSWSCPTDPGTLASLAERCLGSGKNNGQGNESDKTILSGDNSERTIRQAAENQLLKDIYSLRINKTHLVVCLLGAHS